MRLLLPHFIVMFFTSIWCKRVKLVIIQPIKFCKSALYLWSLLGLFAISLLWSPKVYAQAANCEAPNLMMILDRSGSMVTTGVSGGNFCSTQSNCSPMQRTYQPSPGYTPRYSYTCTSSVCNYSRWDIAVNVLKEVAYQYGGTANQSYNNRKVRFGLSLFNSAATINNPIISNPPDISTTLSNNTATGGTGFVAAFSTSRTHLQSVVNNDPLKKRPTHIMFITDGEPSEACANSVAIVRDLYNGTGTNRLADNLGNIYHVKTYVIGYGTGISVAGQNCLRDLAVAGGTQRCDPNTPGCVAYYAANNYTQIQNAMESIINNATQETCDGFDNDCDGYIDNMPGTKQHNNLTRSCASVCGSGQETCVNGKWVNCSARQPQTERCNNQDDDCNGIIDDPWRTQKGTTCTVGVGNCMRTGVMVCKVDGTGVECSVKPGTPQQEQCNGQDDDCNGIIDDPWRTQKGTPCTVGVGACTRSGTFVCKVDGSGLECSVQPGTPQAEKCDGIDNNCDGRIDENWPDKGNTCTVGVGACMRTGTFVCRADGSGLMCSATPGSSSPEVCDGIDNDCDGQIDNNLTPPLCEKQLGVCKGATKICGGKQGWLPCDHARYLAHNSNYEAVENKCDGLDNDCNGQTDERWSNLGQTCHAGDYDCRRSGTWQCRPDKTGVYCTAVAASPQPEQCNGQDDDCDGQIDNNLTPPPCEKQLGVCKGATKICGGLKGWLPCDDAQYKAYNSAYEPVETKCDGLDNDCNGTVDELWPNLGKTCHAGDHACQSSGVWKCKADQTGMYCTAVATQPQPEQCNGKDDDCDGQIDNNLTPPLCEKQQGVCQGATKICGGTKGWLPCDDAHYRSHNPNYEPTETKCDGLDNDCNGQIDDGLKTPMCEKQQGVCQGAAKICGGTQGWLPCDDARYKAHNPNYQPFETWCDNLDNDCNGQTDEQWAGKNGTSCSAGLGVCKKDGKWVCKADKSDIECSAKPDYSKKTAEICDGLDNDCDGQIDNDLTPPLCEKQQGVCRGATKICGNTRGWLPCDDAHYKAHNPNYQSTETWCDGLDNDCNGSIDELWRDQKGKPCSVGVGMCKRDSFWACKADKSDIECPIQPGNPDPELCDGLDNNCDGQIDEDWPDKGKSCSSGAGACQQVGKWVCKPDGSGLQCSNPGGAPEPEICDGIDNDCNGLIDDGLTRPCQTTCGTGIETCNVGRWEGCTAPKPSPEICDGIDNDCDGQVDNGLTRPCKTACGEGKEVCVRGRWVFCDAPQPESELCDGLDNDCNGLIDDLPPRPCQSDCGTGMAVCKDGKWTGCSGPQPEPEICDGKDNDCNGIIDDVPPRPCQNECGTGKQICQHGQWLPCDAPQPQPELCDGRDNDCDGVPDNGANCPPGMVCRDGACRPYCRSGECPAGMRCVDGVCVGDACSQITCPEGQRCMGGRCIDPCELIKCPSDKVCFEGTCINDNCYFRGCPDGQQCINGYCQSDPCRNVNCPSGQFCREGQCISSCANIKCGDDEICIDGKCEPEPNKSGPCHGVTCPDGHICKDGKCEYDPCHGVNCPKGHICKDGVCTHDPCVNIKCPTGQICRNGQCVRDPNAPEPEPNPEPTLPDGVSPQPDGGTITTDKDQPITPDTEHHTAPDADNNANTPETTAILDKSSGTPATHADNDINRYEPGCGCQTQNHIPFIPLAFFALFALLYLLKRRPEHN
jgi:hypothetical protein